MITQQPEYFFPNYDKAMALNIQILRHKYTRVMSNRNGTCLSAECGALPGMIQESLTHAVGLIVKKKSMDSAMLRLYRGENMFKGAI